jgi:hypothetical protein
MGKGMGMGRGASGMGRGLGLGLGGMGSGLFGSGYGGQLGATATLRAAAADAGLSLATILAAINWLISPGLGFLTFVASHVYEALAPQTVRDVVPPSYLTYAVTLNRISPGLTMIVMPLLIILQVLRKAGHWLGAQVSRLRVVRLVQTVIDEFARKLTKHMPGAAGLLRATRNALMRTSSIELLVMLISLGFSVGSVVL